MIYKSLFVLAFLFSSSVLAQTGSVDIGEPSSQPTNPGNPNGGGQTIHPTDSSIPNEVTGGCPHGSMKVAVHGVGRNYLQCLQINEANFPCYYSRIDPRSSGVDSSRYRCLAGKSPLFQSNDASIGQ